MTNGGGNLHTGVKYISFEGRADERKKNRAKTVKRMFIRMYICFIRNVTYAG